MLNNKMIIERVWEDVSVDPSVFKSEIKSDMGLLIEDHYLQFAASDLWMHAKSLIIERCSLTSEFNSEFTVEDLVNCAVTVNHGVFFLKKIEEICRMILRYPEWMLEV